MGVLIGVVNACRQRFLQMAVVVVVVVVAVSGEA